MAVEELQGKYELMFILDPNMTQDETDKELESIKKFLEKNGKIFDDDIWGLRDLETKIRTNDKGYYVIYYLDFNPESITELNEFFTLNQNVLRHLLLTIPTGYEVKGYLNVVSRYEDKGEEQNLSETKVPKADKKVEAESKKDEQKADEKEEAVKDKEKTEEEKVEKPAKTKSSKKDDTKKDDSAKGDDKKDDKEEDDSKKSGKKKEELKDVDKILDDIMNDISL